MTKEREREAIMWQKVKVALLVVPAITSLECSQEANCDLYDDCHINISGEQLSVDKTVGARLNLTLSNYYNVPSFVAQQENQPDKAIPESDVTASEGGRFAINLTCDFLSDYALGAGNLSASEQTPVGKSIGNQAITITGKPIFYPSQPDAKFSTNEKMNDWAIDNVDLGYVDSTQSIIAVQQGTYGSTVSNTIFEYKYDSVKNSISINNSAPRAFANSYPAMNSTFAVRKNYVLIGRAFDGSNLSFLGCSKSSTSSSLDCSQFSKTMPIDTPSGGSVGIALTASQEKIYAIANSTPNSLARMDIDAEKSLISYVSIAPKLTGSLITLFDVDQDQYDDLLYVDPMGKKISVYKNDKNNNFAADPDPILTARLAQKLQRLKFDTIPIKALRVGDIDGAGSDDLIIVQDKTVSFLQAFADGCMQLAAASISTPSPAIAVAVGDLDGKGPRDVIVMSGSGSGIGANQISVYLGK